MGQSSSKPQQETDASERSTLPSYEGLEEEEAANKDPIFWELNWGYRGNDNKWKDMSVPRPCSYRNGDEYRGWETTLLGEIYDEDSKENGHFSIPVEQRGITIRQLRAIYANIVRRCEKEKWTDYKGQRLAPEDVSLYDVNKYIILPYTETSQKSFVETLPSTAGSQPPRWFISHFWGEPVVDFMRCLEQHMKDFEPNYEEEHEGRGGGMWKDTPVWICSYANNQNDLDASNMDNPGESSFIKAMKVANFRTLAMLDRNAQVLTRVWVIFELYLTLMGEIETAEGGVQEVNGLWAVYTPSPEDDTAVGIVPGGVPADREYADDTIRGLWNFHTPSQEDIPSELASSHTTLMRESIFPRKLISKCSQIRIEESEASEAIDRNTILNYIRGEKENLTSTPPESHAKYTSLNEAVGSNFARTHVVLATALHGDQWKDNLELMAKNTTTTGMKFDFDTEQWKNLTGDKANELMRYLPIYIESLVVYNSSNLSFIVAGIIDWLEQSQNLKRLEIKYSAIDGQDGGRDMGAQLAQALGKHKTIEHITLYKSDLIGSRNAAQWGEALAEMNLKSFSVGGLGEYTTNSTDVDDDSCVKHPYRAGLGRVYKNDDVFPDAMLLDGGLKLLAEGIMKSTSLKEINFRHHGISEEGVVVLGDALMSNDTIEHVNIFERGDNENEVVIALEQLQEDATDRIPNLDLTFYDR